MLIGTLSGHVRLSAPLFHTTGNAAAHRPAAAVRMGLFDSFAAAFDNDDTLGESGPAGLKTKVQLQKVTWMGPKPEGPRALFEQQLIVEQEAMPGTPLKTLAEEAGVKIRYSCNKGTCGICDIVVDGVTTPACTANLGKGKDITIQYQDESKMLEYSKQKIQAERLAKKAGRAPPASNPLAVAAGAAEPGPARSIGSPSGLPAKAFGFFGQPDEIEDDEDRVEEDRPRLTQETLEARIRAQMEAEEAEAKKKKLNSPWPFG